MGNHVLFALGLALAPLAAYGNDPSFLPMAPPPQAESAPARGGIFGQADLALSQALASVKSLEECMRLTGAYRADLASKQRELKAEFGGQIPPAFTDLLLMKRKRADKQEARCTQAIPAASALFERAHNLLRNIEPKETPGITARFKKLEEHRVRYNKMTSLSKAAPK